MQNEPAGASRALIPWPEPGLGERAWANHSNRSFVQRPLGPRSTPRPLVPFLAQMLAARLGMSDQARRRQAPAGRATCLYDGVERLTPGLPARGGLDISL